MNGQICRIIIGDKKCRCLKCDLVRVIGAKNNNLPKDEQEKYSFIDWPVWSDQWFPKNKKQYYLNTNMLLKIHQVF